MSHKIQQHQLTKLTLDALAQSPSHRLAEGVAPILVSESLVRMERNDFQALQATDGMIGLRVEVELPLTWAQDGLALQVMCGGESQAFLHQQLGRLALARLVRDHGLSFARLDVVVEQADPDERERDVLVATASFWWSPLQGAG